MTARGPQAPRRAQARPQPIPRPPARPNAPVSGAAQSCPLRAVAPCDPSGIAVSTRYKDQAPRRLSTRARLRGGAVPRGTDPEVRRLLGQYDLLIDTIAGYPSNDSANPSDKLRVGVATEHLGRCCRGQHPRLSAQPNPGPEQTYIRINTTTLGPLQYQARPSVFDERGASGVFGFWATFAMFLPGRDPKYVMIRAQGCGRRAPGAGNAVGELNALLRVYRAGEWKIKLTVPAVRPITRTRGGTASERAERAAAEAARAANPEQSQGWNAEEYRQRVRTGLTLKVERNGVELQGAQRINRIVNYITQFRDTLKALLSAMERWPQFGWRFVGKFNVLEGSLELAWEPEALTTPEVGGRYLPVRTKMGLKATLKVIDIELELSFGMLARSEAARSQVEARIMGTLKFYAGLQADLPLAGRPRPITVPVVARGELEARARANATVAGATIINGTVAVHGAIKIEAGFVRFWVDGIRTGGTVKSEAVELEGEVQLGPFPPWKMKVELLAERVIARWG